MRTVGSLSVHIKTNSEEKEEKHEAMYYTVYKSERRNNEIKWRANGVFFISVLP